MIEGEGRFQLGLGGVLQWRLRSPEEDTSSGPELSQRLYDCDRTPTTLPELALGKDARNCSRGKLRTVDILDVCYPSMHSGQLEPMCSSR